MKPPLWAGEKPLSRREALLLRTELLVLIRLLRLRLMVEKMMEDGDVWRCLEMMEQECLLAAAAGSVMEFRLCWTLIVQVNLEEEKLEHRAERGARGECHISGLSPGDKCSEQIFDLRPGDWIKTNKQK